jgi:hypothetical protein
MADIETTEVTTTAITAETVVETSAETASEEKKTQQQTSAETEEHKNSEIIDFLYRDSTTAADTIQVVRHMSSFSAAAEASLTGGIFPEKRNSFSRTSLTGGTFSRPSITNMNGPATLPSDAISAGGKSTSSNTAGPYWGSKELVGKIGDGSVVDLGFFGKLCGFPRSWKARKLCIVNERQLVRYDPDTNEVRGTIIISPLVKITRLDSDHKRDKLFIFRIDADNKSTTFNAIDEISYVHFIEIIERIKKAGRLPKSIIARNLQELGIDINTDPRLKTFALND